MKKITLLLESDDLPLLEHEVIEGLSVMLSDAQLGTFENKSWKVTVQSEGSSAWYSGTKDRCDPRAPKVVENPPVQTLYRVMFRGKVIAKNFKTKSSARGWGAGLRRARPGYFRYGEKFSYEPYVESK